MPHLQQRGIDMGFIDNDALVAVLTRILETFATKEELEAVEAGGVTVDAALSDTSTNPVQNMVIKAALDGKSNSGHKHSAGDITSGTLSVERGGTNRASWQANRLIYPTQGLQGTTAFDQLIHPTTDGGFLRQNKTGAPFWTKPTDVLSAITSDTDWLTYSTTYPCVQYRVVNNIMYLRAYSDNQKNLSAGAYTTVGRVPTSYKPSVSIYFPANTVGGGKAIDGFVGTDGYIKLYSQVSTGYWAFSLSYPI